MNNSGLSYSMNRFITHLGRVLSWISILVTGIGPAKAANGSATISV